MQKYINNVTDRFGNAMAGLSVRINLAGTQTLASIFSDNGSAPKANPFTTDTLGNFYFYAADGRYDILVGGTGYFDVIIADGAAQATDISGLVADVADLDATTTKSADLAQPTGSTLVGFQPTGGTPTTLDAAVKPLAGIGTTPAAQGRTEAGVPGISNSPFIGGYGTPDPNAATKTRPTWGAIGGPEPTVGSNSLGLTGHTLNTAVNSALIVGGRASYYNYVGPKGSVSYTYGGDSYNGHLAGQIHAFHCDLVDDVSGTGSHGGVFGGSYQQIAGDYSASVGGTVKKVFALQSVALGGRNILIASNETASLADSTLIRRCATVAGLNLRLSAGYESAMVAGNGNTHTSGDRSVMIGGSGNEMAGSQAVTLGGESNKATAINAVVRGKEAIADIQNSMVSSSGKFVAQGDNQNYEISARRTFTGVTDFLSVSGGAGVDLYTPPANTAGLLELNIVAVRTDTPGQVAAYKLLASFSNIGGALAIKAQTLTVVSEDDVAYSASAEIVGAGTRVGVRCTTPSAGHTTRWTAHGRITMLTTS